MNLRYMNENYTVICISVEGTAVKILISEFPVIMEIMTNTVGVSFWGQPVVFCLELCYFTQVYSCVMCHSYNDVYATV